MHCMDADYAVFSLLPPYNTIHAQLIDPNGTLVNDPSGITVTYQAIADPDGSINTTSAGKTNFWDHVESLFGVALPVDSGLAGSAMPGAANVPQPMTFDSSASWFTAEGIPLTPYDDAQKKNSYPLMELVARDSSAAVLATTRIVLPISDEMDCRSCHRSDGSAAAKPFFGWVRDPDLQRDMRLNILLLHDDRELQNPTFQSALATAGYSPDGLYPTVKDLGISVLCARCHASNALPGSGLAGVRPLTQAIHSRMAGVIDPTTGLVLDSIENRSACYRCHPGSVTRCLRGAMGAAVAPDGSLAMQCQSCHGSMRDVAADTRMGWLDEPACQSCHTGTAVSNSGQIRYTSVFDDTGAVRVAANSIFATTADTPAPGLSLYRFSSGHGGLKCEACHGSTHAIFPTTHRNDNLQSIDFQGHAGVLVECANCHGAQPVTVSGGPHGMHPVGGEWVSRHSDAAEQGRTGCRDCHGVDYRGTVLSRSQADRALSTDFGTKHFWRGFQIGCYTCHQGPNSELENPNRAAVAGDASITTEMDVPVGLTLSAQDPDGDGLEVRIVSQPVHGTVGLSGTTATYFPEMGFSGADTFTFAAWDGSTDSNLAMVHVAVSATSPSPTVTVEAMLTPTPTQPVVTATPSSVPHAALTQLLLQTDSAIVLDSSAGFPPVGTIRIDRELITYSGKDGNTLTGVTRGVAGTSPASHDAGAAVVVVGLPGDANCDADVTSADLPAVVLQIGASSASPCGEDADGNGKVDAADLAAIIAAIFKP